MKIRIVFPLVACASLSTAAFAADPWDSPFTIQAGAFWAQAKTSVRLDSNGGRLGTEVNLESDLNVSDKKVSPDPSDAVDPWKATVVQSYCNSSAMFRGG